MKAFLIGLVVVVVLGVAGFFGFQYLTKQNAAAPEMTEKVKSVSKTGVVQKLPKPGDDYTHMLKTSDGLVKLNSYTVKLDPYAGQTITVTGQYSGNTLFVDKVTQ